MKDKKMLDKNDIKNLDEYISIVKQFEFAKDFIEFRKCYGDIELSPICVLSHNFDKRRSKFLLKNKSYYNVEPLVFVYNSQKKLYADYNAILIDDADERFQSVTGKYNYVCRYLRKSGYKGGFIIEDDCFRFSFPIPNELSSGLIKNERCYVSNKLLFTFWQFLINKYNLTYSGLMTWMCFRFYNLYRFKSIIKRYSPCIQVIYADVVDMKAKNIAYNTGKTNNWDDYDMNLQQCLYSNGTHSLCCSYITQSMTNGISNFDNLRQRSINSTLNLIEKYGLKLVNIDLRKNIMNAKPNFIAIKKHKDNILSLLEPLKITDEMREKINKLKCDKNDRKEIMRILSPKESVDNSSKIQQTSLF